MIIPWNIKLETKKTKTFNESGVYVSVANISEKIKYIKFEKKYVYDAKISAYVIHFTCCVIHTN